MKKRPKYLYHSTDIGGLEYLKPYLVKNVYGIKNGVRGVMATNDIASSRPFGIPITKFAPKGGGFTMDPTKREMVLRGWKFSSIPRNFTAYTYWLDPKDFRKHDDWQWISKKKIKVLKVEPYNLRSYLLKNFKIYETVLKRVRK